MMRVCVLCVLGQGMVTDLLGRIGKAPAGDGQQRDLGVRTLTSHISSHALDDGWTQSPPFPTWMN